MLDIWGWRLEIENWKLDFEDGNCGDGTCCVYDEGDCNFNVGWSLSNISCICFIFER